MLSDAERQEQKMYNYVIITDDGGIIPLKSTPVLCLWDCSVYDKWGDDITHCLI